MINIVLFEPEIPPNTGNIIRLCANTGYPLHLIEPLGFDLSEKSVRRAGLDYRDLVNVYQWPSLQKYLDQSGSGNVYAFTTKGTCNYASVSYNDGDILLFGPETRGLPDEVLTSINSRYHLLIPMRSSSRSMNLSNAVAIASYEAWRQHDFIADNE